MNHIQNTSHRLKIPKWLHELHGEYSTRGDLILTHITAWTLTGLSVWFSLMHEYALWVTILMAILMVDIAGGVISNFTQGTNRYYADRPQKRTVFLILHLIQPILLLLMFPEYTFQISPIVLFTLFSSFFVNYLRESQLQKTTAVFLTVVGLTGILILPIEFIGLQLILILFLLKLILSFPVDWYSK